MGFRRGVVFVCSLVVSALVFAATSTAAMPRASVTYKTARIKAAGISLQYPSTWTVAPLTKKGVAALFKQIAKKNPKLAQGFNTAAQAEEIRLTKFFAFDLSAGSAGNVQVENHAHGGFPSSLDEFTAGITPTYQKAGFTVVRTSMVKVSGKTSYRIDVRLVLKTPNGTARTGHDGALFVPRGDGGVVIVVSALDDSAGAKLIDRILASVRRI